MIIDIHTHIFPDKVAEKAIPKLSATINLAPSMNGTANGLLSSMERAGVDLSVILPAITNVKQFDSIIRFADSINDREYSKDGPRLFSIAGMHPDMTDYKEKLTLIRRMGFKGIKLHPDYQNAFLTTFALCGFWTRLPSWIFSPSPTPDTIPIRRTRYTARPGASAACWMRLRPGN